MRSCLLALWICLLALPAQAGAPRPALVVFAAASLKESLDAVAADWTTRSGQPVRVSFASSAALARQIEQGAPADIFLSADAGWMDYLQQRALVDAGTRRDLLANELVLVAPVATAPERIDLERPGSLREALGAGRLAVAEIASVPAGRYARQSLQALGHWDDASPRLAQGDNVRAALAFVARGEAPLGIVYATDARAEPKVRVVARLPAPTHAPIVYPVARVAAAEPARSAGFLAFLGGPEARARFHAAGFFEP